MSTAEEQIKSRLDTLWKDLTNPDDALDFVHVKDYKLPYKGTVHEVPIVRGLLNSHDCIMNSIEEVKKQDIPRAIAWLMAADLHNLNAQDLYKNHIETCIKLLSNYK